MIRVPEVDAVMLAWRPLGAHSADCEGCRPVVGELRRGPDDPYPLWDRLCARGQELFTTWIEACGELAERLRASARPWGLAGRSGVSAEDRAAAITALPEAAARDIWATADEGLREAKIAGVIASWRARSSVTQPERDAGPPKAGERECAYAGCQRGARGGRGRFAPPKNHPRKAFCSDACRFQARDEREQPKPVLGFGLDEEDR